MKKRILSLVLTVALCAGLAVSAFAAESVNATPSPTKLLVNGKQVAIDAYVIHQNNYIKLRDLAAIINGTEKNFNVTWDGAKDAINLVSKTPYVSVGGELAQGDGSAQAATLATSTVYVDGNAASMTAYVIGQNNYFKLRDVMQIFDVYVGYDNATGTAIVDTSKSYEQPATPPAATTAVSDNWMDLEFTLDGVKFALPFAFNNLQTQGWTVDFTGYKDMNENYVMNPGDKVTGTIELTNPKYADKFTFWIGFKNNTATTQTILNCDVWTVKLDTMHGFKQVGSFPDVTLAKGLTWGAKTAEILAALGEPKETYNSTSATSPKYTKLTYQYEYDKHYVLTVYDDFGLTAISMDTYK